MRPNVTTCRCGRRKTVRAEYCYQCSRDLLEAARVFVAGLPYGTVRVLTASADVDSWRRDRGRA